MTSPLYSVGQHVAVCTKNLESVIPATVVIERKYWIAQGARHAISQKELPPYTGWGYRVAGGYITSSGEPAWYCEHHLRPINPDTEYLTDSAPQKLETPTQEEAGTTGSEPGRDRAKP